MWAYRQHYRAGVPLTRCGPNATRRASCVAPSTHRRWIGHSNLLGDAGAVVVLILVAGMRDPSPKAREKGQERDAIALCWKDYDRKSLDPATKRFVASACELMEKRFREKHSVEP